MLELCKGNLNTYLLIVEYVQKCMNSSFQESYLRIIYEEMINGQDMGKFRLSFLIPLVLCYTTMIIIGSLGSGLVIFVVLRSKILRTPRNMFILNLAITDFLLCVFSQPFNIIRLLSYHNEWIFGTSICKLVGLFTGTNVCVSTISITAIALDRYQVILYPSRKSLNVIGAIKVMIGIWVLSLIIASPLLFFSDVETVKMPLSNHTRCTEHSAENYMRRVKVGYSILTLVLLYLIPLTIVSITYTKIYTRIKQRILCKASVSQLKSEYESNIVLQNSTDSTTPSVKQTYDLQRQRRANILLLSITVVFAISWLPLNLSNMIMDLYLMLQESSYVKEKTIVNQSVGPIALGIQSICLLMVLTSACTNPILYGWLNESFRQEFKRVFQVFKLKN